MKKRSKVIIGVLCVLILIPLIYFGFFLYAFGWEGITFGHRVSKLEKHYSSLSSSEYEQIIKASQETIQLWQSSGKEYRTYRINPAPNLEGQIPAPLKYLNPRRVDVSEYSVFINFLFMMDSGASIIVQKEANDWVILGAFHEFEKPYELYRKKPIKLILIDEQPKD